MITLTREEAQQVLDALEDVTDGAEEPHKTKEAIEALRARLAEPEKEQEPVAYDVQKALYRAYVLGQKYWADADSESYSRNKRADKHRQDFETLCEEALFCTAPPQREWHGLTDEEIKSTLEAAGLDTWFSDRHAARVIEAKLKEKNA